MVLGDLLHLIWRYGYLVVFLGVMLESTGVPLPGETILIAAGALVHKGVLDLGDALFFGILGAVIGDQLGYWAGRFGGRPFVLRWGRYTLITPVRLAHAEAFFARRGGRAVFLARFVAGLRGARRRHQPHALGQVRPLQRPRRNRVGLGDRLARLLSVG